MRKRNGLIFALIALATVLSALFFSMAPINAATREIGPLTDTALPTIIEGDRQYYLSSPPNYANNSYKITRVFLEKATCYIYSDTRTVTDIDFTVPAGMFLFIVNGTIKNDYSAAEILKLSGEGESKCIIGLDIYLYDTHGNFINTLNRGNALRGCTELNIWAREKADFTTVFVASVENVAYFEVYVSFLKPLPLF